MGEPWVKRIAKAKANKSRITKLTVVTTPALIGQQPKKTFSPASITAPRLSSSRTVLVCPLTAAKWSGTHASCGPRGVVNSQSKPSSRTEQGGHR